MKTRGGRQNLKYLFEYTVSLRDRMACVQRLAREKMETK